MNRQRSDDSGVSLIELLVYMFLTTIILGATTLILINSLTTQKAVTSVTEATNRGQTMGTTIERAMRNALAFDLNVDGTELRVRTSFAGNRACQAFSLTDGQARMYMSSSALPASTSWGDWEQGISRDGTTPYFSDSGSTVTYTFKIQTDSAPVRIAGEASTRSVATGVTAPCW